MKLKFKKFYMSVAFDAANLSHCVRNKVGSVIVQNDSIISYGYNGTPSGDDNCCETEENNTKSEVIHAEINAIAKAAKEGYSCDGAFMFITMSPCIECAKLIKQSGIKEVWYYHGYRDMSGVYFLRDRGVECYQFGDYIGERHE